MDAGARRPGIGGFDGLTALRSGLIRLGKRAAGVAPLVLSAFIIVPGPPPVPGLPAIQQVVSSVVHGVLPTPGVPVSVEVSPPALIGITASPTPVATSLPRGSAAPAHQHQGGSAAPAHGAPQGGLPVPFTSIVIPSPLDVALIGALVTLPLLFGIWLLLFGRALTEARHAREAQLKLALAADLGVKPRELVGMSARTLFELREKATFDELTGAMRRAAGVSAADREISRARRHRTPMAVAFVDVDGLKEANDSQGHQAGDRLLRDLASALKGGLRKEDVVFRYGGDEFVCVLPETELKAARAKLSSIQTEAARKGIRFCAGVAELRRSDDVVSLFARADADLYDFKANRGEIVELRPAAPVRRRGHRSATTT